MLNIENNTSLRIPNGKRIWFWYKCHNISLISCLHISGEGNVNPTDGGVGIGQGNTIYPFNQVATEMTIWVS